MGRRREGEEEEEEKEKRGGEGTRFNVEEKKDGEPFASSLKFQTRVYFP